MVEAITEKRLPVPINRKQGTVLTSVGYSQKDFEEHVKWVGFVEFEANERESVLTKLEEKGLVIKEGDSFKLTPEGETLSRIVDIAFFKED